MSRVAGTEKFCFNHTMIRVKDPKASLEFYQVGPLAIGSFRVPNQELIV
jgi:catechol 2,3-dioxygenase-like lactoylglutathione lyase family enzyme